MQERSSPSLPQRSLFDLLREITLRSLPRRLMLLLFLFSFLLPCFFFFIIFVHIHTLLVRVDFWKRNGYTSPVRYSHVGGLWYIKHIIWRKGRGVGLRVVLPYWEKTWPQTINIVSGRKVSRRQSSRKHNWRIRSDVEHLKNNVILSKININGPQKN